VNSVEPLEIADEPAGSLLIVDDIETNRDLLVRRLRPMGLRTACAADGAQALDMLRRQPFDLVLLDIMMPVMDGFEVLERMKRDNATRHIPVIVITAMDDVAAAARCIEMGAEDYLAKPFNPVLLKARVDACLERKRLHDQEQRYRMQIEQQNGQLEDRVRKQVYELSEAQLAAIFAMSKLAESRDPETGEHLERMREYCKVLSEQLSHMPKYRRIIDRTFIDNIYAASPLHDIGKVGVEDGVLLKPGALDDAEWRQMRKHPLIGAETLRQVDRQHPGNAFIRTGIDIAEYHHEKWDGSGYPYGSKGEAIPLVARILALGDVYDALTSRRCYKEAFDHGKSRAIIVEGEGRHFDPEVVAAFLEIESEFQRIRLAYLDPDEE
jgi:putative two-component system response regulator